MANPKRAEIRRPTPSERADVAALALRDGEPLSSGPLDVVWGAWRGDRLLGAVGLRRLPGRTARVLPARLAPAAGPGIARQLYETLGTWLDGQRQLVLAHVLLRDEGPATERALLAAGFAPAGELLIMQSTADAFPDVPPSGQLDWVVASDTDRLAELLARSEVGSRDLPALQGLSDPRERLRGYRATGTYRNEWWQMARHAGQTAGCLLLTDHPAAEAVELLYVGLVPEARGRGGGHEAVRRAQWLAAGAGRQRLVLAVDAANRPARRTYVGAGFAVADEGHLWFRVRQRARLSGESVRH